MGLFDNLNRTTHDNGFAVGSSGKFYSTGSQTFNHWLNNTKFADTLRQATYDAAGVSPSGKVTGKPSGVLGSLAAPVSDLVDTAQSKVNGAIWSAKQAGEQLSQEPTVKGFLGLEGTVPPSSGSGSGSFSPVAAVPSDGGTPVPAQSYVNADIAQQYGMDTATAYQEALANTTYQRAVKDLQSAGLNPILAAQGLGGGSGVYGARVAGDGTVSTGVSSAANAHKYYQALSNIGAVFGGIFGRSYGTTKAGQMIGGAIGNMIDKFVSP